LPIGTIDTVKSGTDLTVVSYGTPLYTCSKFIRFANAYSVRAINLLCNPPPSLVPFLPAKLRPPNAAPSIELVDLRTINPMPIQALAEKVKKSGRMVIVHEAGKSGSVGNDIAGEVGRRAFEYLEAPVGLVAGWE
jgi:2-oxoisovalerate dehydrogenase E1 component beta subunit